MRCRAELLGWWLGGKGERDVKCPLTHQYNALLLLYASILWECFFSLTWDFLGRASTCKEILLSFSSKSQSSCIWRLDRDRWILITIGLDCSHWNTYLSFYLTARNFCPYLPFITIKDSELIFMYYKIRRFYFKLSILGTLRTLRALFQKKLVSLCLYYFQ